MRATSAAAAAYRSLKGLHFRDFPASTSYLGVCYCGRCIALCANLPVGWAGQEENTAQL